MIDNERVPYQISSFDRIVGVVIVIALLIAGVALVRHFRVIAVPTEDVIKYYSLLNRSYGITKGADIRLAGITIGNVSRVRLMDDGQVRLTVKIFHEYENFMTEGSYLEVSSTMGLEAIVELTRLNFVSNRESKTLMPDSSFIRTVEPTSLSDTFNTAEVEKVAENVKAILENLRKLSGAVSDNQQVVSDALRNVGETTQEVREAMRALPGIADSATKGFDAWEKAGTSLHWVIDDVSDDVREVSDNAVKASERLNSTLAELERLIELSNKLSDKLNRHWLLGDDGTDKKRTLYSPSIHPNTGISKPKQEPVSVD
jgi:ABC-type transporter Mla subunit MlaD